MTGWITLFPENFEAFINMAERWSRVCRLVGANPPPGAYTEPNMADLNNKELTTLEKAVKVVDDMITCSADQLSGRSSIIWRVMACLYRNPLRPSRTKLESAGVLKERRGND
jgi:hypothetical protein